LFYTKGLSEQEFFKDLMVIDAVIRNFEIIGEAVKRVSSNSRIQHPHIPWKQMAGMRDRLIHDYEAVNLHQLWDTICDVLPHQEEEIESIIASFS
jgi:uncharacterized protein with HEPN domain